MKKRILAILLPLLILNLSSCKAADIVKDNFNFSEIQYRKILTLLGNSDKLPRTALADGTLVNVGIKDWTSGFFPGSLWYIYEYTNNPFWKKAAEKQSEKLLPIQFYNGHHDIGFMMYCSYGNAYRLTNNDSYKTVLINTANSLCSRFMKTAGVIRSWDSHKSRNNDQLYCPVIIDNMMNLELLFFASKATGDDKYRKIAISHADSTLKYHIREDFSCFHVVNYDTITGKVTNRGTHQGYADNTAWARGQAWGIYGFTTMYRETKDIKYLNLAKNMTDFYLNHPNLPKDLVPYWDFNDPDIPNNVPRDASAAAIVASGLFEMSTYLGLEGKKYFSAAEKIIQSLSSNYRTISKDKHSFILKHSVGNKPKDGEVDVPLNYADYYFLEALLRYKKLTQKN